MFRRIIFGVVWCVVLYFGACMITGGIAGGQAGAKDPANAAAVGAVAGAKAVEALRVYFLMGALAIATVGTAAGILPGTQVKKSD
jgi:hypothetical protein